MKQSESSGTGQLTSPQKKILSGLGILAAVLLLWWVLRPQLLKVPLPDESTFLYEGLQVSRGKLPYRDFFEFIGPGTLFWVGGLIKLFGMRILALRLTVLATVAACILLTVQMAQRFLPCRWQWLLGLFLFTVFVPMALVVQHHLYSALLALLASYSVFCALEHPTNQPRANQLTALSGLSIGLCALFTQSLGGLVGAALAAFLWMYGYWGQKKPLFRALADVLCFFVLPALLPILLTIGYFQAHGALGDLTYDTFGWLMEGHYNETTSHWYMLDGYTKIVSYIPMFLRKPGVEIAVDFITVMLEGFLPCLAFLWAGQILLGWWQGRRTHADIHQDILSPLQWQFLLLLAAGAGFFLANFSYPNSVLVALHGWLLYILAFMALRNLCRRWPNLTSVFSVGLLLLALCRLLLLGTQALDSYQRPGVLAYGTVEKVLSPVIFHPDQVTALNGLVDYIHHVAPPGSNLFIYNGGPEFYLMTDQTNPTRYQILMSLYNTPAQIAEAVASLRRTPPVFIIYNQLDRVNFKKDLRFYKLRHYDYHMHALEALLDRKYLLAGQMGNLLLYQRLDTLK